MDHFPKTNFLKLKRVIKIHTLFWVQRIANIHTSFMADFLGTFDMLYLALLIDHVSKNEATLFILSKRKVYISIILDLFA